MNLATYNYQEPAIFESEFQTSPLVQAYFAATGHTTLLTQIHRADLVTLSSGALSRAATTAGVVTTPANLALAVHDETATFTSSTTGSGAPPGGGGIGNLFGFVQASTISTSGLLPAEVGQVHVNLISGGQLLEMSLDKAVAWAPTTVINAACYLYLDSASNLFYVSTTAGGGAQFGVIKNVVIHATQGLVGDFGVRVIVAPLSTVVI